MTGVPERRPAKGRLAFVAALAFVAVVALVYGTLAFLPLPRYGYWTGIPPLESKLVMLEDFAAKGEVDALVLGSSIADSGFNAELFSELMTRELGRPFRVFNFATGGAEPRTMPKLYRLARTACRPRAVWIVHPLEPRLAEEDPPSGPDRFLRAAPVNELLGKPLLLPLFRLLRNNPLLANAPAIRDLALYGRPQNRQYIETARIDDHGDRVTYLMTRKAAEIAQHRKQSETWVQLYPGTAGAYASGAPGAAPDARAAQDPAKADARADFYFAHADSDGLRELRALVESDGGKLHVFAHGAASTLLGGLPPGEAYRRVRRDYYETLASIAGAGFTDPLERVSVSLPMVQDYTHLNAHGAVVYTRAAVAAYTGRADPPDDGDGLMSPVESTFSTDDPSFGQYTAMLVRPAGQAHESLRFRLVASRARWHALPARIDVALRGPGEADTLATATRVTDGEYVVSMRLPAAPRREAWVLRLLTARPPEGRPIPVPVASYDWLPGDPARPTPAGGGPDPSGGRP